jgi:integrase
MSYLTMPQTTLTEITLRALRTPESGQLEYWDKTLAGFGVRVSQGGTRTFTLLYGTPRQRVTIGRYPIISLSDARAEAKRILAENTLGKHRPRSVAWQDAQKAFLTECAERVKERDLKDRTVSDYTRLLNKHFTFGRRQLSDITADDIARRIERITDAPSERNHALVAAKVFLRWAQKPPRRYITHNPCEGMVPTKRPSRKRVLTDAELSAVYRTALKGNDAFSHIIALLILTGQRRGEIGALRREWINPKERTITLPDFITKNGVQHTFPYGHQAAAILKLIPDQGEYLFPASRAHVRGKPTTTFNGWPKHKEMFDKSCGVSDWTLHDLRRTFATNLAGLKVPPHIVERLLNHKFGSIQNQTDGIVSAVADVYYRHLYMDEMCSAIVRWEKRLNTLVRAT